METITFSIAIHASKEKVWQSLWEDAHYREWTSVFTAGSHAESDWNEGSTIRFLDGAGNGMYSIITTKIDYQQMTFAHQGELKQGVEQKKDWGDATEQYHLIESGGSTTLKVSLLAPETMLAYFREIFPKALTKVKAIAER